MNREIHFSSGILKLQLNIIYFNFVDISESELMEEIQRCSARFCRSQVFVDPQLPRDTQKFQYCSSGTYR